MIDAIAHLMPRESIAAEYRDDINDVLDAALAWKEGTLPLNEVMHLGTIPYDGHPSCSYTRFVAVATATKGDPRRHALMDLQRLTNRRYGRETSQGFMSEYEDHQHDHAVAFVKANGPAPWEESP